MGFKLIENGKPVNEEQNENWNIALRIAQNNTTRQLINRSVPMAYKEFGEAYPSIGGRLVSVNQSETTAEFSTNKYRARIFTETVYVVIKADEINSTSDFAINNCVISKIKTDEWVLTCTTGTNAVKRAQIYKTLFYGTNGTNPRATSTYITNISQLRTSIARDVGKTGYYGRAYAARNTSGTGTNGDNHVQLNLTFTNTTDNDDCAIWSFARTTGSTGGTVSVIARTELPTSTNILSVTDFSTTTDHTGTDRESNEKTNPANGRLEARYSTNQTGFTLERAGEIRAIFLAFGNVTASENIIANTTSGNPLIETSWLNFNTTHSVPNLTLDSGLESDNLITHNIPSGQLPSNLSALRVTPLIEITDWEDGADVQVQLKSASDDSGFISIGRDGAIIEFDEFDLAPDELIIKLVPKSSSPTAGIPAIRGYKIDV
jgi:hypothetical protein